MRVNSSTQISIALGSGEAELHRVVKAVGMGLGYQSLLQDLDVSLPVRVRTDSTAAVGICQRQGIAKLRQLNTHTLWIQQAVRIGRIDLRKTPGEQHPADIFTKHTATHDKLQQLVRL